MATTAVTHFSDRLADAVERKSSQLVVGLDPMLEHMPADVDGDLFAFCSGVVDAVAPHAVAVKPQSAFFEAHGAEGVRAFALVCEYARSAGLLVIADAKRGDIGSTA
jgi:orotidine-5'-phosphate decarboxylase